MMFKPMHAARSEGKFKSFDELAKRLVDRFPDPGWPAVRALAVKIADIDRGDKIWWVKRPSHAQALAGLLEVPLVDLGLHDAPLGDMFKFVTFPELPPLALARETGCEIGFVAAADRKQNEDKLQFWLDTVPPRFVWRGPEQRISWLEFQPGNGLDFFWAVLHARSRHEHVSLRRLADARERLRRPGSLIIRIERPCEDEDLIALGGADEDLNLLIVAPFGAPSGDRYAPAAWLPSWDALTGLADERVAALTNPNSFRDSIASYGWRLHDDWQARLLVWAEKRMDRATGDTLFTAKGVATWLATFPDGWQLVKGPADLLAICRLCHVWRETILPRVTDSDAGKRLLMRIADADNAMARRFTALASARLEARELNWTGTLSGAQWAALVPEPTGIPDVAALLDIADGGNQTVRRQRAKALAERILATSVAPLVKARLLVDTGNGMQILTPQFLVDLVARDELMRIIRDEGIERWAMYCHDPQRSPLVDAALGSLSIGELIPVLDRLKVLPPGTLAAVGAAEALFQDIGRRIYGKATVPQAFECLAGMVLSRLDIQDYTPYPLTRAVESEEQNLEWTAACWAWSLWCSTPPLDIPETWAWWFPAWVPDLATVGAPFTWRVELPDHAEASNKWQRMMALAARLAARIAHPPEHPPTLLKPMLLVEGLRGRWDIDPSWLSAVIGNREEQPSRLAEDLLLNALKGIGPSAAPNLLAALMDYCLSPPGDSIRHVLFHRSRTRIWALQNISMAEAVTCLTELQLETLWQAPHTLPPHILLGMLRDPDSVEPSGRRARMDAVQVLGADHADTLSRLLETESLGLVAAARLWAVAPETAERLLNKAPKGGGRPAIQALVYSAPIERTAAAARTLLSSPGVMPEIDRRQWARQRLSGACAHAELLGQMLDLR